MLARPHPMTPHELRDDVLLDLFLGILREVDADPRLAEQARVQLRTVWLFLSGCAGGGGDEHDLVLPPVEVVPDDDLVAVSFESSSCLWEEQIVVRFELRGVG